MAYMMDPVEDRVYNIWSKYTGEKNNLVHDQASNSQTTYGRNVELESLLTNEKQRSALYEVNMESLKNEYSKLETENVKLLNQIETLCQDCENIKQVYEDLLNKARYDAKTVEEKYLLKSEGYKQHMKDSEDKWKVVEQHLWLQIKDLESQLNNVISAANQHAHQYYMREQELNLAKQETASYRVGTEEHLKTKVDQVRRAAERSVQQKNEELQAELNKVLNMSQEKTSLQMHVQSLSGEVEQLCQEKKSFAYQLTCVETELQKALADQRCIITTLQGEKQVLESRLKDRTNFNEQLRRENILLDMEVKACQTEINSLNIVIQGLVSQNQTEQQRIHLQVEALKNTLKLQEEAFRKTFHNEKIMQEKIINDLLQKNELFFKANKELLDLSKKTEASKDTIIENLELKIMKLEAKLEEERSEMQELRQLLENKEEECTRNKVLLADEVKGNADLKKFLEDSQQLVETCNQNDEMSHMLSEIHDKNNMQVNNLAKLLEANQEVCEHLKKQLLAEKEESKKLIDDMNKYEDMRHCKHNEEMLQLVSKIRDLKVQLKAEKVKNSPADDLPRQASGFSDVMSVSSD